MISVRPSLSYWKPVVPAAPDSVSAVPAPVTLLSGLSGGPETGISSSLSHFMVKIFARPKINYPINVSQSFLRK